MSDITCPLSSAARIPAREPSGSVGREYGTSTSHPGTATGVMLRLDTVEFCKIEILMVDAARALGSSLVKPKIPGSRSQH
jgi:hypothetical protein